MFHAQSPLPSREEEILLSIQNQLTNLSIRLDRAEGVLDGQGVLPKNQSESLISEDEVINSDALLRAKEAIGMIAEFDGTNCENFIAQIEQTKKLTITAQHNILLRFILAQKLKGSARGAVRVDMIENFKELIDRLRFQFGEKMSIDSIKMEIRNCRQRMGESLDMFIGRFVKLVDTARITIHNGKWKQEEIRIREDILAEESRLHFVANLPDKLYIHVNSRHPTTLNEAIQITKKVDMELNDRRNHGDHKVNTPHKMNNNNNINKNFSQKFSHKQSEVNRSNFETCNFCKRFGHKEEECRKKKAQNFHLARPAAKPPINGSTNFTSEGNPGHPEGSLWYK